MITLLWWSATVTLSAPGVKSFVQDVFRMLSFITAYKSKFGPLAILPKVHFAYSRRFAWPRSENPTRGQRGSDRGVTAPVHSSAVDFSAVPLFSGYSH